MGFTPYLQRLFEFRRHPSNFPMCDLKLFIEFFLTYFNFKHFSTHHTGFLVYLPFTLMNGTKSSADLSNKHGNPSYEFGGEFSNTH